jgi:hypothetical protein
MYNVPQLVFLIDLLSIWMSYLVRFVPFDKFCGWKYFLKLFQLTLVGTGVRSLVCRAVTEYAIISSAQSRR